MFGNKNMSRLGKQPIEIPKGVSISQDRYKIMVKGPLGTTEKSFVGEVDIKIDGDTITLTPKHNAKSAHALWGTYASHLRNMIEGVTKGYVKKLIIDGVGYRMAVEGENMKLNIGYSHPVLVAIPKGLKVTVEKNVATVSGYDKETVGQFSANVRSLKKPEPYKGKGIRYDGEVIRRKAGKKVTTSG